MTSDSRRQFSSAQTLITGVYRTGSSYLAQLLGEHPELSVTMYRVNVIRFMLNKYDPIASRYQEAVDDLSDRIYARYEIKIDAPDIKRQIASLEIITYGEIYDIVMASMYLTSPKQQWAEKNQLLWRDFPVFCEMMSNAKCAIIIRDPRAVLASFKYYTTSKSPAYLGAVFNCLDAMQHVKKYRSSNLKEHFFDLTFESLIANTEKVVREFWSFLDLRTDVPIDRQRSDWKDSKGDQWHVNSSFSSNAIDSQFNRDMALDRWKEILEPWEIAFAERVCGAEMEKFGYATTTSNKISSATEALLQTNLQLKATYQNWKETGEGIQAFPTDPLDPTSWDR